MQIGVLEPLHFSKKAQKALKTLGDVELYQGTHLTDFMENKEVLFIRLAHMIDAEFLDKAPVLKYICTPTTGLNHINLDAVDARGIKILSLKGESEFLSTIRATPEHTLGLLIALLRNYKYAFLNASNTLWDRDRYRGLEIYGKRVGIIGMGRVGKILSKYFAAFDARVAYTDITEVDAPKNTNRVEEVSELITQSDIIFLTASYSKANEKMINRGLIDLMKDKFFINTARGELVDEAYLIEMIAKHHFKGVALDVINNETNLEQNMLSEFLRLSDSHNLIITPHIAGASYESMWRTEEFITQKLLKELE